jgi:hypothetical protein
MNKCECSVCYELYNKEEFKLKCNHDLCNECYNKIKSQLCPLCRCKISIIKKRHKTAKGKINLNRYEKIKIHLRYKYNLPSTKRINKIRQQKNNLLRILYPIFTL